MDATWGHVLLTHRRIAHSSYREVPPNRPMDPHQSRGTSCDEKGKTKAEPIETQFQIVMKDFRESIAALRVVAETIEHDFHHPHCTGGGQALANVQESVRHCKAAWKVFHDDIATQEAAMQGSERAARVLHLLLMYLLLKCASWCRVARETADGTIL